MMEIHGPSLSLIVLAFAYGVMDTNGQCPNINFVVKHTCGNGGGPCTRSMAETAAIRSNQVRQHMVATVTIFNSGETWTKCGTTCVLCRTTNDYWECTGKPHCVRGNCICTRPTRHCVNAAHDVANPGHYRGCAHYLRKRRSTPGMFGIYGQHHTLNPECRRRKKCCKVAADLKMGGKCFPGDASVTLADKSSRKMKDLKSGDIVAAIDPTGKVVFSEVYAFAVKYVDDDHHFYKFFTKNNRFVEMTSGHQIFVQSTNDSVTKNGGLVLRKASQVLVGDYIHMLMEDGHFQTVQVSEIQTSHQKGAYAPLTKSGTIVVNGFAASCFGRYPALQQVLRAPVRFYYGSLKYLGHTHDEINLTKETIWFNWFIDTLASFL